MSLVLIKAWSLGNDHGTQVTTSKYEAREKAAKDLADKVRASRQTHKEVGEQKGAQRGEAIRTVYVPVERKVIEYVKTPNAGVTCLNGDGQLRIQESINAANDAIANASR